MSCAGARRRDNLRVRWIRNLDGRAPVGRVPNLTVIDRVRVCMDHLGPVRCIVGCRMAFVVSWLHYDLVDKSLWVPLAPGNPRKNNTLGNKTS